MATVTAPLSPEYQMGFEFTNVAWMRDKSV